MVGYWEQNLLAMKKLGIIAISAIITIVLAPFVAYKAAKTNFDHPESFD